MLRSFPSIALALTFALTSHGQSATPADKLQGDWVVTSAQRNGKAAPDIVGHQLTFDGKNFVIRQAGGKLVYGGTYAVEPRQKPARILFKQTKGLQKGKTWHGIYKFKGTTLVICDNGADPSKKPPRRFATTASSGHVLVIFKRKDS